MVEIEEDQISCPVCWVSSASGPSEHNHNGTTATTASDYHQSSAAESSAEEVIFAKTPCNHVYCRTCIERVLLPDIATMGTCPMCRTAVSIFDLKHATTEKSLYPSNSDVSSWPIANNVYKQFSIRRRRGLQSFETEAIFRNTSFSFNEGHIPKLQYLNKEEDGEASDADGELQSFDFQRYHFHPQSMTFHGRLDFDTPIPSPSDDSMCYSYSSLNCLLQFSDGGQYIRDGYIHWGYESTTPPGEYPLDGKWKVEWENGEDLEIYVQRHYFNCFEINYEITLDDNHCPRFEWPNSTRSFFQRQSGVVQRSTQQIPPGSSGPSVGETLEWSTNLTSSPKIVWKRISMALSPKTDGRRLRIRPDHFVYRNVDFQAQLPPYVATSIWGNTFCQMYTVGLASYHFEETTEADEASSNYRAYISYEHPHTNVWPALDNGENVPGRVPFRNIEWDPVQRIFKGDICWQEEYNTTWMGEDSWH
eukprot:CAMPEP_0201689862 /NCGR_PEP_ID=MMETSP0578-20130828/3398_1 /ASSEMBLY_ACC=CAM_ASM_000663 /TAXON_ID=267565 /ORGANISM="Skeletonema grethea, Strain CCMP 1804" /LENGTH=475 /DNA_ID=CAMNT_0048174647 /DNA_START=54 /DNA_END=1481 /DNA_ORIENTATION=-